MTGQSAAIAANVADVFPSVRQGRFLDIGGFRMHVVDAGDGDPILCVHGNPTWSFYWRAIIDAFATTHRVLAVDHIGCGLSDKPQRYDYSLRRHIRNLLECIERLDLSNITLVAHDWGGPIGVGAALEMPERFRRLVLTNTACFPPPFIPFRIRICRVPVVGTVLMRGANVFARGAMTMATTQPGGLPLNVRRGLLAPYDSWHNRVGIDRFVFDIPLRPSQPTWQLLQEIESGLRSLADKPCLLLWGMRDWCFRPECLRRLQQHFPNARTVEFAGAGHYLMEDAPREVVAAIAGFLSTESSGLAKPLT